MTWKTRRELKNALNEILPLHLWPGVHVVMIEEYRTANGENEYCVTADKGNGYTARQTQTLKEWRVLIANRREQYIEGPKRQAEAERARLFDLMDEA